MGDCISFKENWSRFRILEFEISIDFSDPHQIPYTTPRIFNVTIPSRDKMDMTMEDGLTGVCALVDANVKPGNRWV